ncbi:ShlB/FhaC/HecB family hemolysin secretion/activation protein [Xenorhabdus sp. KK7.4]|uniref:ShlB/FhaC/HecB family hemolysin secretion/activation protein n=1 Tax=Xenorhabdus sp. KK7.4 TaxID=1851572 RepID=UPI000C0671A7|nr:ShlB/FhaC/HecB family hemolysin secretion/activation protein [Xenorhabdus sp. KK7.4]PHM50542.1 XhlB, XhlA hemolysin secretion/activation protein [Xenorhabdus sp. KK7.4]
MIIKNIGILLILYVPLTIASPVNFNENLPSLTMNEGINNLQNSEREINRLIEERRHQEMINRSRRYSTKESLVNLKGEQKCLPISGIYLQGISLLSSSDLKTLSPISNSCITSNNINRLTSEITNLYVQKGYVTARVKLVPPDYEKKLGIHVIEGFIEDIRGGSRWVNSQTLFPGLKNMPLNIHQLDQGLDQANRLQSNKTTLDILPGTINGGSIVFLNNKHSSPWKVSLTTDNYGQKNTGKWVGRVNTSFDSPLGLSDFVSLSGSSTLKKGQNKYNRSYIFLYSLPYGKSTFSTFYVGSKYHHQKKSKYRLLNKHDLNIHGDAQQSGIRAEWAFRRNQTQIDTLRTQFIYKKGNNYLNDEKIIVNSESISLVSLNLNHFQIIPTGFFSIDIGIDKGVPWFNAQTVMDKNFIKGLMSINLQKKFRLFDSSYLFNSQISMQYSHDPLPAMECFSITDKNSIRGFNESFLCSDNGWYLRNTLSYLLPIAIPQGYLALNIGGDLGQTKIIGHKNKYEWINAVGMSTGFSLSYKQLFADIQVGSGKVLSRQYEKLNNPIQILVRISYGF